MGANSTCCQQNQIYSKQALEDQSDLGHMQSVQRHSQNQSQSSFRSINTTQKIKVSQQPNCLLKNDYDKQKQKKAILIQQNWKRHLLRKTPEQSVTNDKLNCSPLPNSLQPTLQNAPIKMSDYSYLELTELPLFKTRSYQVLRMMSPLANLVRDPDTEQIIQYDDQSVYQGQIVRDERNGIGIYFMLDNMICEGQWSHNVLFGEGRIIYPNLDVYQGGLKEGIPDGQGTLQRSSGSTFRGHWTQGLLDGNGSESWIDGASYVGEYMSGKKQGKGKFEWSDGSTYEGELMNNCLEGEGTMIKEDGKRYQGQWMQDMMHGYGQYFWPDGRKYQGQYSLNKKHGLGTFEWSSRKKYIGFWNKGVMHGRGLILYSDGRQEEGQWIEGEMVIPNQEQVKDKVS